MLDRLIYLEEAKCQYIDSDFFFLIHFYLIIFIYSIIRKIQKLVFYNRKITIKQKCIIEIKLIF